jgi:hypothetical protein
VDLVLCAGMASGTGGITAMIRCQNNSWNALRYSQIISTFGISSRH